MSDEWAWVRSVCADSTDNPWRNLQTITTTTTRYDPSWQHSYTGSWTSSSYQDAMFQDLTFTRPDKPARSTLHCDSLID